MRPAERVAVPGAGPTVNGAGRELVAGAGCLLRGIGMYARSPRLMVLGLVPAFIAGILLVALFVLVVIFVDDAVRIGTPYADGWSPGLRTAVRLLVALGIVAGWVVLSLLAFVALTLFIGQPFYEAICKRVEEQLGGVPHEVTEPLWRSLTRSAGESVRLLGMSMLIGLLVLGVGVLPVVGQVAALVLGATLGGWVLALELSGVAFQRRGLYLRERRRMLRSRRPMALGFGAATFLCFLVPLGAVLLMPAAVVGATLMSRRLLGLPDHT